VTKLDRGFVYPEYPTEVLVSYFEAGSICDFVATHWGEEKLLAMVDSFRKLESTREVVEGNFGVLAEEFDAQYLAWITEKYGREAEHFNAWRERLKALNRAGEQKHYDLVLDEGPVALAMYPEYVDEGNVYQLLADAGKARGDAQAEAAILTAYEHQGGQMPEVLKRLAELEEARGKTAEAAATLARLNYIYPVKDEKLHRWLGDLRYAEKNYQGAIREYTAAVASNPVDMAAAEYHLAQAYFAAGQRDKAQESVLAALETAPGYRPAQKLLLELQRSPAKSN
jgi:tetratricopeptide (TPR) repeat protein